MEPRYFKLKPEHGLDAAGQLEPIQEIGVSVVQPTMVDGDIVDTTIRLVAKPIADTRIAVADDPRVALGLIETGLFDEVDKPTKRQLEAALAETADHRGVPPVDPPKTDEEVAA